MFSVPTFKLVNIKTLLRKLQYVFFSLKRTIHKYIIEMERLAKLYHLAFLIFFAMFVFSTTILVLMHYDNESFGLFVFRVLNLCVMH